MIESSVVGRSFAPTHARVEPGRLRYFFNTLGESNPVFRDTCRRHGCGIRGAAGAANLFVLPRNDGCREPV